MSTRWVGLLDTRTYKPDIGATRHHRRCCLASRSGSVNLKGLPNSCRDLWIGSMVCCALSFSDG